MFSIHKSTMFICFEHSFSFGMWICMSFFACCNIVRRLELDWWKSCTTQRHFICECLCYLVAGRKRMNINLFISTFLIFSWSLQIYARALVYCKSPFTSQPKRKRWNLHILSVFTDRRKKKKKIQSHQQFTRRAHRFVNSLKIYCKFGNLLIFQNLTHNKSKPNK